ncbi:uncharacterized protein HMPREF1541_08808 [Cyphellophora europaea CBS 101466]|uniref:Glycogen debranching enzyme n=1 Tax=Cyphellophora europaea (strain CBS 101466) TaxID=1220924 RepID=W2RJK8_CYPE1|nr:uncharacterized protein HMPREF1541_08808 [Cyphellophora europaea CBS 101466]ETN36530.1 hypothetical protein HMPREF1541_08808 [Cyphellophora europaea CBS 101466]
MLALLTVLCAWLVQYVVGQSDDCQAVTQHLSDPPYENYFYSDCNVDAQAVVTSPLADSNLTIIGPRLIVAWPAGNSGIATFFQPQNGPNGTLAIALVNSTYGSPLGPVHVEDENSDYPYVGVQGVISFNSSASLTVPILGSVRTIRDFTEGPSLLYPEIQGAINVTQYNDTGAMISRLWLDNTTISNFTLMPYESENSTISIDNRTLSFGAGFYVFSASFNYPQLQQLTPEEVLNNDSQVLITQQAEQTTSLSFLSYTEKLVAGAWRFLTYFGRDSMIAALLLEPVLSTGNGSATEAVIGAVLERINRTDGSVCHEETLGDYATWLNLQDNVTSTDAVFVYPMIDTDFYLPIIMSRYFSRFPSRIQPLLFRAAGTINIANQNLTYGNLTAINAQKIYNITSAFADDPTIDNLIHLKPDELVGQWRDSTYGLGGGRIPFDVNTALVPAALRALAQLARVEGVFPAGSFSAADLNARAQVWEDSTLQFFQFSIPADEARDRLDTFVSSVDYYSGPTHADTLPPSGENLTSYALALDSSYNNLSSIPVLHSDTSFRLFFVNGTNQTQLTTFLNATASDINRPFPAGLSTGVGMVVANPALSGSDVLTANFTNSAYHGTVVWSWTLAMMAEGLNRQLARCDNDSSSEEGGGEALEWCGDQQVYGNVRRAYNTLWDGIEANEAQLQSEVWSWTYSNATAGAGNGTSGGGSNGTMGGYQVTPLGALPPPPGVSGGTESNVRQLWSLTFLAVTRNEEYR